jgi:hypothetical protein
MDWKQLLTHITGSVDEELRLRNAYLAAENRILRHQLQGRVPLTDTERTTLAVLGKKLGKQALQEIATIAQPDTILTWHRKLVAQPCNGTQLRTARGRPRIDKELEDLVVRMARENRSWGYDRMVGAWSNLGYPISDQTVGNIWKRHGIPPAPARKKTTTWNEFIRIHRAILMATDFFTAEVWSWYRLVLSALLVLLGCSRYKVHDTSITAWLTARCAPWPTAVKRWVHAGIAQGLSWLLQRGTRVQRDILIAFVLQDYPEHFPHGMGKVMCLPMVRHHPIRDGPRRRRPRLGGLLQDVSREAA